MRFLLGLDCRAVPVIEAAKDTFKLMRGFPICAIFLHGIFLQTEGSDKSQSEFSRCENG